MLLLGVIILIKNWSQSESHPWAMHLFTYLFIYLSL